MSPTHPTPTTQPTENVTPNLRHVLTEYQDVFSEEKLRKIAFSLKDKIEDELKRIERIDAIAPVDRPTDWVNSGGNTRSRMCQNLPRPDVTKQVSNERTCGSTY